MPPGASKSFAVFEAMGCTNSPRKVKIRRKRWLKIILGKQSAERALAKLAVIEHFFADVILCMLIGEALKVNTSLTEINLCV